MRISIIAIGRVKAGPERELISRYEKRYLATGKTLGITGRELLEINESRATSPQQRCREEAGKLVNAIPPGSFVIALDEHGKNTTSQDFANRLQRQMDEGRRELVLLIGGADGHGDKVRQRADLLLSFGQMTWPHQLVRLMLAEQLYRATTILANHPYHRS